MRWQRRKNKTACLQKEDGSEIEDTNYMLSIVVDFYKNLFGREERKDIEL
jgi:Zn-dependent metalloprotease